jgi:hypothetical protein
LLGRKDIDFSSLRDAYRNSFLPTSSVVSAPTGRISREKIIDMARQELVAKFPQLDVTNVDYFLHIGGTAILGAHVEIPDTENAEWLPCCIITRADECLLEVVFSPLLALGIHCISCRGRKNNTHEDSRFSLMCELSPNLECAKCGRKPDENLEDTARKAEALSLFEVDHLDPTKKENAPSRANEPEKAMMQLLCGLDHSERTIAQFQEMMKELQRKKPELKIPAEPFNFSCQGDGCVYAGAKMPKRFLAHAVASDGVTEILLCAYCRHKRAKAAEDCKKVRFTQGISFDQQMALVEKYCGEESLTALIGGYWRKKYEAWCSENISDESEQ